MAPVARLRPSQSRGASTGNRQVWAAPDVPVVLALLPRGAAAGGTVPSARFDAAAAPASLDRLEALAAPVQPRAPPRQRGLPSGARPEAAANVSLTFASQALQREIFTMERRVLGIMNRTTSLARRRLHSGYVFNSLPDAPSDLRLEFSERKKGGGRGGGKARGARGGGGGRGVQRRAEAGKKGGGRKPRG